MNELQRQSYLKAMGFTPWVAAAPLPGAAPSPEIAMPEPVLEAEPGAPGDPLAQINARLSAGPDAPVSMQVPEPTQPAAEARQGPTATSMTTGPALTLLAYPVAELWLLVQQGRADAPGLSREEQALLANLLRLWKVGPSESPKRLANPPRGGFGRDEFAELLAGFVGALKGHGARQVLCCVDEQVADMLKAGARYQAFEQAGLRCLAISSLAEMLADPPQHKRASWRAMREAGFAP